MNANKDEFHSHLVSLMRAKIEDHQVFSPRLYLNLTFTGHSFTTIDGKRRRIRVKEPTLEEATRAFLSFCFYNAKKHKTHILPWAVVGDEKEHRTHIHAILSAETDLDVSCIDFWRQSYGIRSSASVYDPSQGGIYYMYDDHDPVGFSHHGVVCPRHKSSCRRSRCIYRRRGTEKKDF